MVPMAGGVSGNKHEHQPSCWTSVAAGDTHALSQPACATEVEVLAAKNAADNQQQ